DSLATGISCEGAAEDTPNVIPLLGPAGSTGSEEEPSAVATCTGMVAALAPGATHLNTGSVSGTPVLADGTTPAVGADGQPLPPSTATDDAHAYAPAHPGIGVVKRINGDDAATAPGVSVPAGSLMMVTFEVTNTGDVRIDPVVLSDSTVTEIRCPAAALDPGEVMTCSANLAAPAVGVQHSNTVTATGSPVLADGTPAVGDDGQPASAPTATDTAYAVSVATSLPQTGANVTGLVGSGLGMLLLGWLLLLASPRRRSARSRRS
ncbi:MAG: LPXTG cell wall anchor domain-containing protein, partial [Candidatus Phosphoribacter baldrii]